MKITLSQRICGEEGALNNSRLIKKEYDSDIKPCVGDYIWDPFWKNPDGCLVESVAINYEDNSCYVTLKDHIVPIESIEEHYECAKLHEWTGYC